jgi:hypothetical protein
MVCRLRQTTICRTLANRTLPKQRSPQQQTQHSGDTDLFPLSVSFQSPLSFTEVHTRGHAVNTALHCALGSEDLLLLSFPIPFVILTSKSTARRLCTQLFLHQHPAKTVQAALFCTSTQRRTCKFTSYCFSKIPKRDNDRNRIAFLPPISVLFDTIALCCANVS